MNDWNTNASAFDPSARSGPVGTRVTVTGANLLNVSAVKFGAVSAQFGPAGGTIGRAATNTLVLDDPDRTVSRVHAQVQCRDGQYILIDRGSNPLLHNGHAVGSGNEAVLTFPDHLSQEQVEEYRAGIASAYEQAKNHGKSFIAGGGLTATPG